MTAAPVAAEDKYRALGDALARLKGAAVAFSGGADSSLLLAAAAERVNGPVLALTVEAEVTPGADKRRAASFAERRGIAHRTVRLSLLDDRAFRANPPDRCYICKKIIFTALLEEAGGLPLLEGSQKDDEGDYRPGRRALAELGAASPLAEAGLTKDDIRALSRSMGLESADLAAAPCLATRIPCGTAITAESLRAVEEAEAFLAEAGFTGARVRHHGAVARIEVDRNQMAKLLDPGTAAAAAERLRSLGFAHIALDIEGYRRGSMNCPAHEEAAPGQG